MKNEDHYLEEWRRNGNKNIKHECSRKIKEVNELTLAWFPEARSRNLPVSGPILQEKTVQFTRALNISDFEASNGWLNKYCARTNIMFRALAGERASVSQSDVEDWLERLPNIVQDYLLQDIYNADETGLLYRMLPDKSLVIRRSDCAGRKKSKERITILLCANAAGDKEEPLVINKSLKPRCFGKRDATQVGMQW